MLKKLKSLSLSPKLLLLPAVGLLMGLVALMTPQVHKDYIRESVGKNVHRFYRDANRNSGGTGFSVKAPSGKTYLLTNGHICEMYEGKPNALVEMADGRLIERRILEISQFSDLCLVEGLPQDNGGMKLASDLEVGQDLMVVGHPKLMNLTVSKGEAIELTEVQIMVDMISPTFSEEQCTAKAMNTVEEANSFFGPVKICVANLMAVQTNAVTLPGNSGSPVTNNYGNLVGVLFAGDNDVNWGLIVPLEDVRDFLSAY